MHFNPTVLFTVVDLMGVLANGILGSAVARQMKMDMVGFVVIALISALGGGLLRDTLLQAGPPVALTDVAYPITAIAGASVAFFISFNGEWASRFLTIADALSLGCWAATGTAKALGVGITWLPSILLGVITAVGGGMIRDIVVGRVPIIFGGNTLYATAALIGSCEMMLFYKLGQQNVGMGVAILSCAALSLLARRLNWRLPSSESASASLMQMEWSRFTRQRREPSEDQAEPDNDLEPR